MTTETMTPSDLLKAANDLLLYQDEPTAGLWPRAAALLGRQALETALDIYWAKREPAVIACSKRAQLLCLHSELPEETVEDVALLWSALSRATHHHEYELAPTSDELSRWFEKLDTLINRINNKEDL